MQLAVLGISGLQVFQRFAGKGRGLDKVHGPTIVMNQQRRVRGDKVD